MRKPASLCLSYGHACLSLPAAVSATAGFSFTVIIVATFIPRVNRRGHKFSIDGRKIVATLTTRMGRKPLSDEDRRDKPFRIRMTDEERQQVDSAAESAGETNSSRWARRVLLEAAGQELARKRRKKS
jgi:hypothetical protein